MRRDCGICQPCQRAGRLTPATEVDHIVALCKGGDDSDGNLESVCSSCHRTKTALDMGHKVKRPVGLDGCPEGWT
jgi:5-methylcytosine-specific restriction protein A